MRRVRACIHRFTAVHSPCRANRTILRIDIRHSTGIKGSETVC